MAGASGARPPYTVERSEVIAETAELRVVELTLAAGEEVPWHHHPHTDDTLYCLEGTVVVERGDGAPPREVGPGERHTVPPGVRHRVHGRDGGRCRFLNVQGPGAFAWVPG
jgi:quercetin dioxygenase-like cupin family protein